MDPTQQSAAEYYKKHRKRSFFSRLTIISSMTILLVVLSINVSALYSQDKSTISSNASTPENVEKNLPSLPAGCVYQHIQGKVKVDCPKTAPTIVSTVPIDVQLPKLPPECSFETSTNGSKITCSSHTTPIPTVPVILPPTCVISYQQDSVACKNSSNQKVTVHLPSLPEGCSYSLVANNYYVTCQPK